jgi:DNA-damage-inducible protein D
MKTELVRALTATFEAHAQETDGGVEYWLARDIQHLLGYTEWRNFTAVIAKAKTGVDIWRIAILLHGPDHAIQLPGGVNFPGRKNAN